MSQEGRFSDPPKIVLFGQTGSGKSSLINMLAGGNLPVAKVASDHSGVTTIAKNYDISNENKTYTFWDTCGLNEGEKGNVPAQEAANKLVDLLKGMSVTLIIYIARGHRFLNEAQANSKVFGRIRSACGEKVPIVLIVTGLEQEEVIDDWWTTNQKDVKKLNLSFKGHACVTTIKGRNNAYEQEYQQSRNKVWKLVKDYCESLHNIGEARSTKGHNPSSNITTFEASSRNSPNIIIFGESGTGKSSIVNMIVGGAVAQVSNSSVGCTFQHERYEASFGDTHLNIYDTAGLNEGDQGRVPHWKAIHELYTLIRSLNGVSLLIYCIRGRITENAQANWILFHKVLCAKKVPIIAVETGLELEEDLDGRRAVLRMSLKEYGMIAKDVACIVSVCGKNKEYQDRYNSSQARLRNLIKESYRGEPWSMTADDWIDHIYKTTYTTKLCLFSDVQVELANDVGSVVDEFIKETGMKTDDLTKLKSTLLDAETKLRRRRLNVR